jgi:hypothetical protein
VRRITARAVARLLALALPALGAVLVLGGPASADDGSLLVDVPGDGVGFTHDPGVPVLDVQKLYPGSSGSGYLDLRNTSAYDATLSLAVLDLVSQENGCLRPEAREPGEGCDADGGELEDWVDVTVTREDLPGGAPDQVLWQGGIGSLSHGADLAATLPAGATWRLRMTVALPTAATNETMSDSLGFDTRFTATGDGGTSTVDGPQVDVSGPRPHTGHFGGTNVVLPGTGGTVSLWMLLLDALVLAVGAVLVWTSRVSQRVAGGALRHTTSS